VDVASHHSVILTRAIALYGRSLAVFLMAVLIGIGLGLAILAWLLMRRLMSRSQV
jgi:ABC-type polysaccharide/polyol phosphate export permease